MRRARPFAFFLAGCATTLIVAVAFQAADALPKGYSPYKKLNIFARVLTYVENNYVEYVNESKLIYGAIKGMMDTLDPHSTFMPPDQYRQMKVETQGEFGGVGIEVEIRGGWITVVSPLEGTPAQRAGLKPADVIESINGKSTRGMQLHEAVRAMRGPRGTRVKIKVRRADKKERLTFDIVRDIIKIVSVSSKMLAPGIGYLRLKRFQERTDRHLKQALAQMTRKEQLRGLILDLRFNGGGDEGLAQKMAGRFLDRERVYSLNQYRSGFEHDMLGDKLKRVCAPRGPWTYRAPVRLEKCMVNVHSALRPTCVPAPGQRTRARLYGRRHNLQVPERQLSR